MHRRYFVHPEGWDVASHAAVRILVAPLWEVSDQQVTELAHRFRQRGMHLSGVVAVSGRRRARAGKVPARVGPRGPARHVAPATVGRWALGAGTVGGGSVAARAVSDGPRPLVSGGR